MQGRLLPKYKGKYQAHPIGYWQKEFKIAKTLGLDCIEFIFDYHKSKDNPLLNPTGLEEIKKLVNLTDVKVLSICADYFMHAPIHSNNTKTVNRSLEILTLLIKNASLIDTSDIIIPCVDQSSLKSKKDINNFVINIKSVIKLAETENVNICLETDLEPKTFGNMIDSIGSKNVTVNYSANESNDAGAISDFIPVTSSVNFAPGETKKTINIDIVDDFVREPSESFTVSLSGATNAVIGSNSSATIVIEDDDLPPTVSILDKSTLEDAGLVNLTVALSNPSSDTVSIDLATSMSLAAIQIVTATGLLTSLFSFVMFVYMIWRRLILWPEVQGFFTLFALVIFIIGIGIFGIGVIGEYVGRIYQIVQGRPRYTLKKNNQPRIKSSQ